MINEIIETYLFKQRDEYLNKFKSINNIDAIFQNLFDDLMKFDLVKYRNKLKAEIKENLNSWWTNADKGIVKEEVLYAILFEYDDYYYSKDVEAVSYGIGEWQDYKVQTEVFNMGYNYDFATEFYAAPGITLNFFDSLEKLDKPNSPSNYDDVELYDLEGHFELMELYKFTGFTAIHQVLKELNNEGELEKLNYKNGFMFIIGEHDSGEVCPLLIKEK